MGKRKILITGATGVIGGAIADTFAEAGNHIVIHCHRSLEKAEILRRKLESSDVRSDIIALDLSTADNARNLIIEATNHMGGLNILIHCAAIFERTPLKEVTEHIWTKVIDANLKAAFFLAQAAGDAMKESGGQMIFLSDISAVKPYAGYLPYCISKAGIDALVRGLAKSLAPNIRVNAIAPYIVTRPEGSSDKGWTDLLNKLPLHRETKPEEIARIAKLLSEPDSTMTGQIVTVDGGRMLR